MTYPPDHPAMWSRCPSCFRLAHWGECAPPTPDRSGEADKTGTGLAEGESGLPEGSSKP